MNYPSQSQINEALLIELYRANGANKPKSLYSKVAEHFSELTEKELMHKTHDTYKWNNLVRWARQALVKKGYIDSSFKGTWVLTNQGFEEAKRLLDNEKQLSISS